MHSPFPITPHSSFPIPASISNRLYINFFLGKARAGVVGGESIGLCEVEVKVLRIQHLTLRSRFSGTLIMGKYQHCCNQRPCRFQEQLFLKYSKLDVI